MTKQTKFHAPASSPPILHPQKQNQKPVRQSSVLVRLRQISDCLLIALAYYFATKPPSENRFIHVKSEIGGKVIMETFVTPNTEVLVPVWVGDWPNQTQTVAYMRWKDHRKYEQKPKDSWGWVW